MTQQKTWSKWELFSLLSKCGTANVTINGVAGILSSVEREDASGSKFNVRLWQSDGNHVNVFVRTVD